MNASRAQLGLVIALISVAGCEQQLPAPLRESGKQSAAVSTQFAAGSLIIPMDITYQDRGILEAYGLVFQLLTQGVPVGWVAEPGKAQNGTDFTASATDFAGLPDGGPIVISNFDYRGGPFVVDSAWESLATPIVAAWQVAHPTTAVHLASASFSAPVQRQLTAAPSFAIFEDSNELIAFGYLNLAGVPNVDGGPWPSATSASYPSYPDVLTIADVSAGSLLNADGTQAWCNLSSMHWDNADDGAVLGVRTWLTGRPVHAFMECAASRSFENDTNGHFLTTEGVGTGANETNDALTDRHPDNLFAQYDSPDGGFQAVNGSEPSVILANGSSLDSDLTNLINPSAADLPDGGVATTNMVWLTGFMDGSSVNGKVSYLGGHDYLQGVGATPAVSTSPQINGVRLFFNGLLESPCSSTDGSPSLSFTKSAPATVSGTTVTFTLSYSNGGPGIAQGASVTDVLAAGLTFATATGGLSSANVGQTVTWQLGNLAPNSSGTLTVTASTPTAGTYANQATLTYGVGRTTFSMVSNTTSTIVGNPAPSAPVIILPTTGSTTGPDPTISGTAQPDATVTITVTEANGTVLTLTTIANASGQWTVTPPAGTTLASGTTTVTASQTDLAGATSVPSAVTTFTVGAGLPLAPVIFNPANSSTNNPAEPLFTGTAPAGSTVTITVTTSSGSTLTFAGTASANGTFAIPATQSLSPGTYTATATATTADGTSNPSPVDTFGVAGTTATTPVITSPTTGSTQTSTTPPITGTAQPGSTVTVIIDGVAVGTTTTNANGVWTFTPGTPLSGGSHTVTATATISSGGTSPQAAPVTFTVATGATQPVITSPTNGSVTSNPTPPITGTATPGATVSVFVDGVFWGTTVADSNGNWTFNPTTPLPDGSHTVTAQEAVVGAIPSAPVTFTVESQAPTPPIIVTPTTGTTVGSTTTVTGTAPPGSTVTVTVNGVVVGTTTAGPDGTWSLGVTFTTNGSTTITATDTNGVGSTSGPSIPVTVTVTGVATASSSASSSATSGSTGTSTASATSTSSSGGASASTGSASSAATSSGASSASSGRTSFSSGTTGGSSGTTRGSSGTTGRPGSTGTQGSTGSHGSSASATSSGASGSTGSHPSTVSGSSGGVTSGATGGTLNPSNYQLAGGGCGAAGSTSLEWLPLLLGLPLWKRRRHS